MHPGTETGTASIADRDAASIADGAALHATNGANGTRAVRGASNNGRRHAPPDPDGGSGEVHDLLTAAVDEAAHLLDADGAMVYVMDPARGNLRFAHDA